MQPILLPQPQRCDVLGGIIVIPETITFHAGNSERSAAVRDILGSFRPCKTVPKAKAWLNIEWDESVPDHPEAYAMQVSDAATAVRIAAHTIAALRHALRTLAQLLHHNNATIPKVAITDQPVFAVRGVMLDISRDRIPTMVELRRIIDQLASWKINHLQLYTEHTFAYHGHDDAWRHASPLTPHEVRQLDDYCQARGIELAANQNCLGHLEQWFRHPQYAALAEIAPGQAWDFGGIITKTGPFSLCPGDERSLELIKDLLQQLLPCFSSSWVNIGCDEAYDLGQGRSHDEVQRRGRAAVYLEYVRSVCEVVHKHGKKPQFWADIALEHPEALADMPSELLGLAWGYEPDAPFARWCQQLQSVGRELWVCPGTSCWRSITGRTYERRANLLAAAREGQAYGVKGFLATAWGDLGHRQQWPITLHALAEAAHRAWSGTAEYDPRASSLHAFDDRSGKVGLWLDDLGDVDRELRAYGGRPGPDGQSSPLRNATALFTDLHKPLNETWIGTSDEWRVVIDRLLALADPRGRGSILKELSPQIRSELLTTLRVAVFAATRAQARRMGDAEALKILQNHWRHDLERIIEEHRRLWLARCRPGGLDDSCGHYQRVVEE